MKLLGLLGVLVLFSSSLLAYSSAQEKKAWNKCLNIKSEKKRKQCMIKFEKKFYPESVYNDEELNWSDINWKKN